MEGHWKCKVTSVGAVESIDPVGAVESTEVEWNTFISTDAWGSDYLDSQPAKCSRHDTDRQEAILWNRLHQLDPRRKRSSYGGLGHYAIIMTAKQIFLEREQRE